MLDLLRFAFALLPLAAYCNILGLLRMRSVPTVLSGAMDFLLLGLAMVGLIAIGPIELFFPRAAYSLLGEWVWLVLLALYFFVVMLIALNGSPKLIVYGLSVDELKKSLCDALAESNMQSEWLGNIVELSELGVRASIEKAGRYSVSQIQSAGREQSLVGWFNLEQVLVKTLSKHRVRQHRHAVIWLLTSFVLFGVAVLMLSTELPRLKQAISVLLQGE